MDFSINYWLRNTNPHHPERPVYWTVYNHETKTSIPFNLKFDAEQYRKTLPHATTYFHWYETEMARLDTTKEPLLSTKELCRLRALELRNTYKYLRLFYSGGADSHSALRSFVDNGIFLDEIVVSQPNDTNRADVMDSTAREILLAALPALKEMAPKIPRTKITIYTPTVEDLNSHYSFTDDTANVRFLHSPDGSIGLFMAMSMITYCHMQEDNPQEDWCDIYGGTKTKMFRNNGKWYFYFVDSALNDSPYSLRTEDFFISRTLPELYLKTVYNTRNYLEAKKFSDKVIRTWHADADPIDINISLQRDPVHVIAQTKLYAKGFDPELWDGHYLSGTLNKLYYESVANTTEGERWFKNYQRNMDFVTREFSDFWNTDSRGRPVPFMGPKGHYSKFYCLNDGKSYDSTQIGF
jgi:hypothetical protein